MGWLTLSGFSLRSARFSRRHFGRLHQSQRLRHRQLVSISYLVSHISLSFCVFVSLTLVFVLRSLQLLVVS